MIRLRTLGTLDLTHSDGYELRAVLSQPRRMALLAYLAVAAPRGFHRRDHLFTLFWPEHDVERARSSLNRAIYFLRRELGDGIVLSRGADELGLNFERFWCDAAAFAEDIDRGEFDAALELYRGDLLPGFFASSATGFEHWLESARSRLRERAAGAAWSAAAESESRGELTLAGRYARRGVDLAPFDEVGVRRLLTLLDRVGDRAGAARAYQEFAERMAAELELTPSPETQALIDDIRLRNYPNGVANDTRGGAHDASRTTPAEVAPSASPSHSPTRIRRLRGRIRLAAGTITVASVLAVAFALPALTRGRIDPRAVYVIPFENRTTDHALDHLGPVAVDRITQALSATGLVDALPGDGRRAPSRSHAGTIVSGEFHLESGRIVFQASITDARRNAGAWAIRPITGTIDSGSKAIDDVSSRVAGAVAALRAPSFASWFPIATLPPTFEAFQEFAEATELQSGGFDSAAVLHLRRAVALDTTFVWARMQLAAAYFNLFEQGSADSIVDELNRQREHLNPLQRHWLAWMRAIRAEDFLAGHRAISAAAEMAPERFRFNVAQSAVRLNRPHEAIAVLRLLGPNSPHAGGAGAYWTLLTGCYHAIGAADEELKAARAARRAHIEPMSALALEIRALAASRRADAVRALLDTALALPLEQGPTSLQLMVGIARISSPAQLMVAAAQELRAHGNEEAAQETLARALAWYRAQPAYASRGDGRQFEIANALYLARDWASADTAFRALAATDTGNYIYLGYLGKIAARRNDEVTARRIMAKFDSLRLSLPQPRATAAYWQAKISSILGDQQNALAVVSEVWPQGHYNMHADFDFERMWNAQGFRALIRPKG